MSGRGGNGRCTAAERDLRVAQVVTWLQDGQSRGNICAMAKGKWGISARTTDAYLRRARELVDEESRAGVRAEIAGARREARGDAHAAAPARLTEMPDRAVIALDVLNMLYEQYYLAKHAGDVTAALRAAEKLAEVAGVRWADLKEVVEDDVQTSQQKVQQALNLLLTGAMASREARGQAPIPVPVIIDQEDDDEV